MSEEQVPAVANDFATADLCDTHGDAVRVCDPEFGDYGGRDRFCGPVRTVRCFEDNTLVRDAVNQPGDGAVLVVDAGGSMRCAMLGDNLAAAACDNGWSGVIMNGCIRDSDPIADMNLGVKALGTHPRRSVKRGEGQRDVPVRFAGVGFEPGQWVYCDADGIIVADGPLDAA